MNRLFAGFALFIFASGATGDMWTSLFNEKLQEARNGSSEAQFDVGTMYLKGRGVQADRGSAIEWFDKAAAQGDARAQSRLKLMQANTKRFERTRSQATKGDRDSLYDLGNMYMKGVGTNIDISGAIDAFEQSAQLGHIKAAYKLGLVYHEGRGTRTSGKQAFKWFKRAAENGYPAAQYYLGKLYAGGIGVRRDRNEALVWLGKAVDGGFDQARGEMINVSENMKVAAAEEAEATTQNNAKTAARKTAAEQKKKAAAKQVRSAKKSRQAAARKARARRWSVEDLMLAAWNRDGKPVSYLPSAINNCRSEDSRVICFSDDQTRNSGANIIKFKTKAIIDNFSASGSFDVTYRNLVISAKQQSASSIDGEIDEPGDLDENQQPQAYKIKTGWSNPHTLRCTMKNSGTVSCVKNSTHAFVLISPTTLAAGR